MARTDRGYAKAYLREPIATLELSHLVRDLPIVKWTREIQKTDHKVHYSAEYFILAVMCDKVSRDGSECPGVECVLEWGISDKEGHKIRISKVSTIVVFGQRAIVAFGHSCKTATKLEATKLAPSWKRDVSVNQQRFKPLLLRSMFSVGSFDRSNGDGVRIVTRPAYAVLISFTDCTSRPDG